MTKRSVFYISDGTGLTAKAFGRSLLTQFDTLEFDELTLPYVDNLDRAAQAAAQINDTYAKTQIKPLVFSTLVNDEVRKILLGSQGLLLDFFYSFIGPLEEELKTKSSHHMGRMHSIQDFQNYYTRMNAVNYALNTDDGNNTRHYNKAEFILLGVSRCGKTPTALYLAMEFGVHVANYPFIPEDMPHIKLPDFLLQNKHKLFGLTIDPQRLHNIRSERRPNSQYASLDQCRYEIEKIKTFFKQQNIPYLDTSKRSIEEIATTLLNKNQAVFKKRE